MTLRTRIITYSGVLFALVVLYILGIALGPQRAVARSLLPGLESDSVTRLEIFGESSIELESADRETWEILLFERRFPARAERVASFLEELSSARAVRVVTRNRGLWSDLGVAESEGIRIAVETSSPERERRSYGFVWGSASTEPGLSFVRMEGADEVVATDAQLDFFLQQPTAYWSYLRLFPEDILPGDVITVTAATPSGMQGYAFQKSTGQDSEQWIDAEGDPVDAQIMTPLLRTLVDLVGKEFAADQSIIQAGSETTRITFDLSDGRQFQVRLVPNGADYRAQAEGPAVPAAAYGTIVYLLEGRTVDRIFPGEPE